MALTTESGLVLTDGLDNFNTPVMSPMGMMPPPVQLPDATTNLADDDYIKGQIREHLVGLIEEGRRQRQPLEEEWRAIDRMEMLMHDSSQMYFGRHNAYLPVFMRIVRSLVAQLRRGLFPSDEYMDVADRLTGDPQRAFPTKAYVQWELESNARVRMQAAPMLGQLVKQGQTVWKRWYNREVHYQGKMVQGPFGPQLSYGPTYREGLRVKPISIFNFYMWPTTAGSIHEAEWVWEDIDVPLSQIQYLIEKGVLKGNRAAMDAPEPDTHQLQASEVHQNLYGIAAPQQGTLQGNHLAAVRTLTHAWGKLKLPRHMLLPNEDPDCPYPVRIVMAGQVPVYVTRNPFLDQMPPYDCLSTNTRPGFIYGYGDGKAAQAVQSLTNDCFNQLMDVQAYCNNPVLKYNPTLCPFPLPALYPGVPMPTLDINQGMAFERPPHQMVDYGQGMVSFLRGLEEDLAGAPPQSQGNSSRQAKTATQAQILQYNSMTPLQDRVEEIENGMLVPTAKAAWMLGQQYRDATIFAIVSGASVKVTPADLVIDAEFRWLASSQAIAQAQRMQQMTQILQVAVNPAVLQLLMGQGYIVDPAPLIARMYGAAGLRGYDSFIRRMGPPMAPGMPVPPEMMAAQAQAFQGAAGMMDRQAPGDRARSATEQAGAGPQGGRPDAMPGEANEFMAVRQQADDLAGSYGGMNGNF
jgi:hypothetical protein